MKKIFILLVLFASIAFDGIFAQSDPQESLKTREKTEFVYTEPYPELQLFYGGHNHLDISLNGAVSSVEQTKVLKHGKDLLAKQQTWGFLRNGHLCINQVIELFLKDSLGYDLNSARPLSEEDCDSTAFVCRYCFNSSGALTQVLFGNYRSDLHFEYDQNEQLTTISTYYQSFDVLNEKVITLNSEGKPVRVEEFNYKDESKSKRACPSDLGHHGEKSVGIVNSYCYDDRGNLVAHQMNNGRIKKMESFVYDSLNNMIFMGGCEDYRGNNNSCKCKGFHAYQGYEYDERHRLIREYSIGEWKPSGMDTYYQYDSAGREIDYKHYDVRGTQRTFDSHIQTTYDSAGRIVKKEALLGDFRINESIFDYKMAVLEEWSYDEHGNLVEHVGYKTKANPFRIVRYQYEYDQQGNWVKRVRYEGSSDYSMIATEVVWRKIEYYE